MVIVRFLAILAFSVLMLTQVSIAKADDVLPGDYKAQLKGSGTATFSSEFGDEVIKVKISATRKPDGTVKGKAKIGSDVNGRVIELRPPAGNKVYWCAIILAFEDDPSGGVKLALLVEDKGTGCDLINTVTTSPDVTCDNAVPEGPFVPVTKNFKGKWRCGDNKCCPNN